VERRSAMAAKVGQIQSGVADSIRCPSYQFSAEN
jgi:hypothetical protein